MPPEKTPPVHKVAAAVRTVAADVLDIAAAQAESAAGDLAGSLAGNSPAETVVQAAQKNLAA